MKLFDCLKWQLLVFVCSISLNAQQTINLSGDWAIFSKKDKVSSVKVPGLAGDPKKSESVVYKKSVFLGLSEEQLKGGNMAVIFGVGLLFSVMLATFIPSLVIHQSGLLSMMMGEPGVPNDSMSNPDFKFMFEKYGHN